MKRQACSLTSLKELKAALRSTISSPEKESPSKKNIPAFRTDEEIFLAAMADVREIREFRNMSCMPHRCPHVAEPRCRKADDDADALRQIVKGERKIRLSDTGEYIEWTCPTLRKDVTKRLHEGGFSIQDSIDLHGMGRDEAKSALTLFFREAVRRHLSCVKVIHGRGLRSPRGPVLKEALKGWLHGPFRKWVIAYATARDCDGGLGATYIMLKSR